MRCKVKLTTIHKHCLRNGLLATTHIFTHAQHEATKGWPAKLAASSWLNQYLFFSIKADFHRVFLVLSFIYTFCSFNQYIIFRTYLYLFMVYLHDEILMLGDHIVISEAKYTRILYNNNT